VGRYWRGASNITNWNDEMELDRSYPKGDECIEKQISDWNPQGARMKRRPKQTCEKTVMEKAGKCGRTWS